MRVTALLQQFLKLRAFVLKPYLHLEEVQQSLGQINIKPSASNITPGLRSNIKGGRGTKTNNAKKSSLHLPPPPSSFFHPSFPNLLDIVSGYLNPCDSRAGY
jgi:hypothetical protein